MSTEPIKPRYKDGREAIEPAPITTPEAMNAEAKRFWAEPGPHIAQGVLAALSVAATQRAKPGKASGQARRLGTADRDTAVRALLNKPTPAHVVARKFNISTKTVSRIKGRS